MKPHCVVRVAVGKRGSVGRKDQASPCVIIITTAVSGDGFECQARCNREQGDIRFGRDRELLTVWAKREASNWFKIRALIDSLSRGEVEQAPGLATHRQPTAIRRKGKAIGVATRISDGLRIRARFAIPEPERAIIARADDGASIWQEQRC